TPATTAASNTANQPSGATGSSPRAPYKRPSQTAVEGAESAAGSTASSESAPPAPAGPSPQEIREAHDRYSGLDARADAARQGVQQIRGQQQAQGLDIRGDILSAMNRMNSNLREANSALDRDDLQAAKDYMDRADKDIGTLEAFLGR
ncbi:MAG: hypothetical protein WBE76_26040, partial [Terracidiphilus sp.]